MDQNTHSNYLPIAIPDLGSAYTSQLLTAWFIDVGEYVCSGDFLYEVTLDHVSVTVHAPYSGYLIEIKKHINEVVKHQEIIGYIKPTDQG